MDHLISCSLYKTRFHEIIKTVWNVSQNLVHNSQRKIVWSLNKEKEKKQQRKIKLKTQKKYYLDVR